VWIRELLQKKLLILNRLLLMHSEIVLWTSWNDIDDNIGSKKINRSANCYVFLLSHILAESDSY